MQRWNCINVQKYSFTEENKFRDLKVKQGAIDEYYQRRSKYGLPGGK